MVSTNDRWLIVSNSPETLSLAVGSHETLYKCSIVVPATGLLKLRLYAWHLNTQTNPLTFQLRIGIAEAGTIGTVSAHRSITPSDTVFLTKGICVAPAHLFGSLDAATTGQTVPGGGAELAISLGTSANGALLGTVHEFDITAPVGATLNCRTVASTDSNYGSFADDCMPAGGHARGSWPYCAITVKATEPFDAFAPRGAPATDVKEFEIAGAGSAERLAFAARGADFWATANGNKGMYGVDLTYEAFAKNESTDQLNCKPTIRVRNVGDPFGGAANGSLQAQNPVSGKIQALTFNGSLSCCDFLGPKIPPFSTGTKISILLAVAGAAALPVALTFQSLNVTFVDDI